MRGTTSQRARVRACTLWALCTRLILHIGDKKLLLIRSSSVRRAAGVTDRFLYSWAVRASRRVEAAATATWDDEEAEQGRKQEKGG